jgi:hypothetical protein
MWLELTDSRVVGLWRPKRHRDVRGESVMHLCVKQPSPILGNEAVKLLFYIHKIVKTEGERQNGG